MAFVASLTVPSMSGKDTCMSLTTLRTFNFSTSLLWESGLGLYWLGLYNSLPSTALPSSLGHQKMYTLKRRSKQRIENIFLTDLFRVKYTTRFRSRSKSCKNAAHSSAFRFNSGFGMNRIGRLRVTSTKYKFQNEQKPEIRFGQNPEL
jgi:hypothetical protein